MYRFAPPKKTPFRKHVIFCLGVLHRVTSPIGKNCRSFKGRGIQRFLWAEICWRCELHMGASKNYGCPKMDGLQWKTLLKWMIWGYHHFRKHPYTVYCNHESLRAPLHPPPQKKNHPGNKTLLGDDQGILMVNNPLMRLYFFGGVPINSHDMSLFYWTVAGYLPTFSMV